MRSLRSILGVMAVAAAAFMTGSCGTAAYSAASPRGADDLYESHDRRSLAMKEKEQAEIAQARAEAREANVKAALAYQRTEDARNGYYYDEGALYDGDSEYARKLRAFDSPSYQRPESTTYVYYDSDFNNVSVVGNRIFVEPKYYSSFYGYWDPAFSINLSWGTWGSPYWYGYSNNYWNWRHYYWGDPYYYGGWGYPGWGVSWHWSSWPYNYYHHHHHYGHGWYDRPGVTYRPSYSNGYRRPSSYYSSRGSSYTSRRPSTHRGSSYSSPGSSRGNSYGNSSSSSSSRGSSYRIGSGSSSSSRGSSYGSGSSSSSSSRGSSYGSGSSSSSSSRGSSYGSGSSSSSSRGSSSGSSGSSSSSRGSSSRGSSGGSGRSSGR